MENSLIVTLTQEDNITKHSIYLPSEKPVQDIKDLKIKFYHRGKYQYRKALRGHFETPRNDTQIYINNKYFFVINSILTDTQKQTIKGIIQYCYLYGLSIEEIKTEFKKMYGRD